MRYLFIVLVFIFGVSNSAKAHRGDYIAITDVQISETRETYIYSFKIENIKGLAYTNVRIDFWINLKSVFFKNYDSITARDRFTQDRFVIPKKLLNFNEDLVNIEVTQIFGRKNDWGGWENDRHQENGRQTNTLFSEFYVDAPWRMKKNDENGILNSIPLHFFLHDGDKVTGTKPQIDEIDIQIKNASSSSFGPSIKFNTLTDVEFKNLFDCTSQTDNDLSIKAFDLNGFKKSANTTIDFDLQSDFFNDYVEVNATYWYFNFNIPPDRLAGFEDVIDVRVTINYGNLTFTDDIVGMRIFRSDEAIPKLPNFYRGDTHLHSMYTQNDAEIGLPLCATKTAAKHIGLDWITTTDHTSDFDNYGSNVANNWLRIQTEVQQLNSEDPTMIYIAGQEVALKNQQDKLVHMLAYPNSNNPYNFPFIGDGDGDLITTSVTVNSALAQLYSVNGFAYAAHPFATSDILPTIPVNGGIWNLGSDQFYGNGASFPRVGGPIICNDFSVPSDVFSTETNTFVKDGLKGAQIWNVRNTLESTGDELDPWDVDGGGNGFVESDTASYSNHIKKFRQGLEIINHINQLGLSLKNQDSSYRNWKMYMSSGSDAHGSFNSSNTDDFGGLGTITDNAVGKLNTLVYCPNGMGGNGSGILNALYLGRNVLSDGPILTMGVSVDGDNSSNEILLGDDAIVNSSESADYYLNFDYVTNAEFGDVTKIRFILGTESGEIGLDINTGWAITGSEHQSIALNTLLQEVFSGGIVPQKEYFYIRAEMETLRDLTGQESIYRKNYELHNAFTNPIWIKYDEIKPSVSNLTLTSRPNPFTEGFYLLIQTAQSENVNIAIYDDLGKLVFLNEQYVVLNKEVYFDAQRLGLAIGTYVIKVTTTESQEVQQIKVVKM
jgi:hypothetical protein